MAALVFFLSPLAQATPVKNNLKQGDSLEFLFLDSLKSNADSLIYPIETIAKLKDAKDKAEEADKAAKDAHDKTADADKAAKDAKEGADKTAKEKAASFAKDEADKADKTAKDAKDKFDAIKGLDLSACSNLIVTSVSNEPATGEYTDVKGYYVKIRTPHTEAFANHTLFVRKIKTDCTKSSSDAADTNKLHIDKDDDSKNLFWLNKDQIEKIPHVDVGTTYGIMTVPFKKYDGGTLKDGSTIGAYLGYKSFFPESFSSFAPVISLGYGTQKYDAIDPSTSQIAEFSGGVLSGAAGVIFGFSFDRFKIGLLVGRDYRNSAQANSPSFAGTWYSVMFGWGLEATSNPTSKNNTGALDKTSAEAPKMN